MQVNYSKNGVEIEFSKNNTLTEISFAATQAIIWLLGRSVHRFSCERTKDKLIFKGRTQSRQLEYVVEGILGHLHYCHYYPKSLEIPFEGGEGESIIEGTGVKLHSKVADFANANAEAMIDFFARGATIIEFQGSVELTQIKVNAALKGPTTTELGYDWQLTTIGKVFSTK